MSHTTSEPTPPGPDVKKEVLAAMEIVECAKDLLRVVLMPPSEHRNLTKGGVVVGLGRALERINPEAKGAGPLTKDGALSAPSRGPWVPVGLAEAAGVCREDVVVEVYCPEREGLAAIVSLCRWHPDAGFCVDEVRHVTHFRLHEPPEEQG